MEEDSFPTNYQSWKRCITEKCKIALTKEYVDRRIAQLSAEQSTGRGEFIDKYGPQYTQTVLGYFQTAKNEVAGG